MSNFNYSKPASDSKSSTLGSMNRQHVIQETNKKRTFLKDSSWIKARPEEDEEEKIREDLNFGRNVLSRYRSQENLERDDGEEEKKAGLNRFKSDDALDRIPSRNTSERGTKSATLERMPISGPVSTNKSRQSFPPSDMTTTTTTTEESKRKSWGPGKTTTTTTTTTTTETKPVVPDKPEGQKINIYSSDIRTTDKSAKSSFIDNARSRFEKTEEKPRLPTSPPGKYDSRNGEKTKPTPLSPTANQRPAFPAKPANLDGGERRSSVERKQRSKDLDNLIEVSSSKAVSSKGTENIDNLIDIKVTADKSKRSDQLDDLIEISDTAKNTRKREDELKNLIEIQKPETNNRNQNIDNLIDIKTTATSKPKENQNLDNLIDIKTTSTSKPKGNQNIDNLIDIKNTATSQPRGNQNIDNLIDIKNTATSQPRGNQNIDNLIDIKTTATSKPRGSEDLDNLIAITGDSNKGITKPPSNSTNNATRSSTTTTTYNVTNDSSDIPGRHSTTARTYNVTNDSQDLPNNRSSTTTTYKVTDVFEDEPNRSSSTSTTYRGTEDGSDASTRRSTTTTYRDTTDGSNTRSNVRIIEGANTRPNTTYGQDTRTSSSYSNDQPISSNSIKTVYSTSDRSVIEKDQCTYCRKPLGIDAKMIMKDLNISCHATCFKCEACSGSLANLKAGDSMWIYKHTIHCEPCYFSAREKWII